ncbi:hypothetical protein P3T23_003474 [Paraburkholderia sp. GAS448]|uniref:DUF3828 domain-containing protein n=1 Tax=Paraburkholderia sp. GAS448 TaxID=3035136 RepID=UPI003D1EB3C3
MRKYFPFFLAALALVAGLCLMKVATAGEPNAPEATVRAFYTWYFERQAGPYQLTDNAIYRYVAKSTVDNLRDDFRHNRLPGESDYFTKVQDYDEKEWLHNMVLHPTIMLGEVAVIPVTFGAKEKTDVVVFVRKEASLWKIIKVENTGNYLGYHQYDPKD